jgi:hypothetical protein
LIERFYNKLVLLIATCGLSVPQLSAGPLGRISNKMKNIITTYTLFAILPLLNSCYTVIKEDENPSVQKKPAVGHLIYNAFAYSLNQYEKLLADGVSRDKALQVFSNISHIDDQGRLDVDIELSCYDQALGDTVFAYKGTFDFDSERGPLKKSYKLPPEAIRAISLIDCVSKIRSRTYGHTR